YAVSYFNGFWAWDSWKHAVALAHFDPELAKKQVRTMFAHMDDEGMIPDVVYLNPNEDNWANTKPPLATWAVWAIHQLAEDSDFVEEMYDDLVRYHEWWYLKRDRDSDGLCEYGSADGSVIAAKWESGMDNAVRFDDSSVVANGSGAWTLDQESVDLNGYLYAEKQMLAEFADELGHADEADAFRDDASDLADMINATHYFANDGFYFDTDIDSGDPIHTKGPEGWTPLWAGVAGADEGDAVAEHMLDPGKFATHVPFPTCSADEPEFSDGYWRGLVWLDQAYFGVQALRRYGYEDDAVELTERLFENLDGLRGSDAPIRENYSPTTGDGRNADHFSWSAAHILLLYLDADHLPPVP
ncbi:MAG: hypothetical protein B7733_17300, partial [Myxococcales bacterium FL481]